MQIALYLGFQICFQPSQWTAERKCTEPSRNRTALVLRRFQGSCHVTPIRYSRGSQVVFCGGTPPADAEGSTVYDEQQGLA